MDCRYTLRKDTVYGDTGQKYIVYGVNAVNENDEIIASYPDIFFDIVAAEKLVKHCNDSKLELSHLEDVLEDALTEQYAKY